MFSAKSYAPATKRVPLAYNMSEEEGGLIDRAFREARPDVSIEVGLGYGISALFACDLVDGEC